MILKINGFEFNDTAEVSIEKVSQPQVGQRVNIFVNNDPSSFDLFESINVEDEIDFLVEDDGRDILFGGFTVNECNYHFNPRVLRVGMLRGLPVDEGNQDVEEVIE